MKKILIFCSPSTGMLDNWFPVLIELKKKGYYIEILFPKQNLIDQIFNNDFYKNFSIKIFSKYHFISGNKIKSSDYLIKPKKNLLINISKRISDLLIKYLNKEFQIYNLIKNFFPLKENVDFSDFLKNYEIILCDIGEFSKKSNEKFAKQSKLIKKISMCHGPDFPYFNDQIEKKKFEENDLYEKTKIILYSNTDCEKKYYINKLKSNNLKFTKTGNPKHDPKWIKNFLEDKKICSGFDKNNTVFLISRNTDSRYLPANKKIEYLENIKKILIDDLNLNIVVKLHPKEEHESYYYKIFKRENLKKNWVFSDMHPLVLGYNSLFTISFFSGVAVDMIKVGKTNIEFLNLTDLEKNNGNMVFYKDKKPCFRISYLGLTLNCQNKIELKDMAEKVITQNQTELMKLKKNYANYYNDEKNAIDQVLQVIIK